MKTLKKCIPDSLAHKVSSLKQLNQQLYACLPTELLTHVHAAGIEDQVLLLVTDSPAWANRSRYHAKTILEQMCTKTRQPIKSVKLLIAPNAIPKIPRKQKKPYLSMNSAQQFETLASSIEHPKLKKALQSLAKRRIDR